MQGISDLITVPGVINLDFADVKTIMTDMGMALMGTGVGSGKDRAVQAARNAISSPLLEDTTIQGAQGVLINITGNQSITLQEVSEASRIIQESAHPDANIIFGSVFDEGIGDQIKITVIATGFDEFGFERSRPEESLDEVEPAPGNFGLQTESPIRRFEVSEQGGPDQERDLEVPIYYRNRLSR